MEGDGFEPSVPPEASLDNPEFKARDELRDGEKRRELAPHIEAA